MNRYEDCQSTYQSGNMNRLVWIRGAGDLATGVGIRLLNSGYSVVFSEIEAPSAIRLSVSFALAVYNGRHEVEGYTAQRCLVPSEALALMNKGTVPVLIFSDLEAEQAALEKLKPLAFVEATIRKKAVSVPQALVPLTIGLGPGFEAGKDVTAVVETNRGHDLGRVIWQGFAEPDTGIPGSIGGYTKERVIHAPADGVVRVLSEIGQQVSQGTVIAHIELNGLVTPVLATIDGVLRGMIHDGFSVKTGFKMADIDPRCELRHCHTVSDKARAIGGGVLEAILRFDSFQSNQCASSAYWE